jgi:hypothetical protein
VNLKLIFKTVVPDGLNETPLVAYGPKSCVSMSDTFLTSHNLTMPKASHETIVSPFKVDNKIYKTFRLVKILLTRRLNEA